MLNCRSILKKIAENLGKSGTYIPNIRPGAETKDYVNKVLSRITVLGSIGLAFIAVLPHALPLIKSINLPANMGIVVPELSLLSV